MQRSGGTWGMGGRGLAIQESRGLPRCSAFNSSSHPQGRRTLRLLTFGVVIKCYFSPSFLFYFTPQSWGRTSHDIGNVPMVIRLDMAKCGSTHGRPPTKSTVAAGFGSLPLFYSFSLCTFPSPSPLPLPLSSRHVHGKPLRSLPLRRLPFSRKYPIQKTHIILSQGGSRSFNNNRLCDFHRPGKPLANELYSLPINPSADLSHPNLS